MATPGGYTGSGTGSSVGGGSGSWTGTGIPANGFGYTGSYSLSMNNGTKATLTIDANGTISGSASGITFSGTLEYTGNVVIFGIPTASGSAVNTATLAGTLTNTGGTITGTGGFVTLDSGAGVWTLTHN